MKIWLDALTPKQLLFLYYLSLKLREKGYKTIITIRKGEKTEELAQNINADTIVIGEHGYTRQQKVKKDSERILKLLRFIEKEEPDILVSYPNPTGARTAFGLSIPIIIYSDTPHAMHAHRLSVPLCNYMIFSNLIDRESFIKYVLPAYTRVIRYWGIDELAWIKSYTPNPRPVEKLGLDPLRYIIVRPPEIHASYYGWDYTKEIKRMLLKLSSKVTVLLVPRYSEDVGRYRGGNIKVLDKAIPATPLIYYSIATITGGGTMARESALLGVPGIDLFPGKIEINEKLSSMGFPLYRLKSIEETYMLLERIIGRPKKYRKEKEAKEIIHRMEHPVKPLLRIIEGGT